MQLGMASSIDVACRRDALRGARALVAFSALALVAATACSPLPHSLCTQASCLPAGAAPARGVAPSALLGTWFAGAGGTKGSLDVAVADSLIAKIDEIAEIFWETKKA